MDSTEPPDPSPSPFHVEDALVDEPAGRVCPVCGDALAAREYKSEFECQNGRCGLVLVRAEHGKWRVWSPSEWTSASDDFDSDPADGVE